jgi:MFS family permease
MQQDHPPQPTTTARKNPRYFYGWNIVAATFVSRLAYAEHYSSTLGLFFKPLSAAFGWNRTSIAAVQTIARFAEALMAPIVGPLVDRFGPRPLMPLGGIIVGFAMLAITYTSSLWYFYLVRGLVVAIGFTLMGQLVSNVAISNWFVRKRGRAIGIAGIGSNLGNVIMTPLIVWLIVVYGWRMPFIVFGIVTFLVVLIPSAIFMRRRPEDMGMLADGMDPTVADASDAPIEKEQSQDRDIPRSRTVHSMSGPEPIWTRKEALTTSTFWLLTSAFAIDNLAFQGINISLAPYIQDLGYGDTMMASVVTFRAVLMAIAMPVVGIMSEYADQVRVRIFPFAFLCIASFLFLFGEQLLVLWLAVGLYGLGLVGTGIVQEVLWANFFGRLSLGKVRSMAILVGFGFGSAGPIFMNAIFDFLGSYKPAYVLFVILFALGGLQVALARKPKAPRYATTEEIVSSTQEEPPR